MTIIYTMVTFSLPSLDVSAAVESAQSDNARMNDIVYVDEEDTWTATNLDSAQTKLYFHDGKQSLRLRKRNAIETAYVENGNLYAIEKGNVTTDFTLTWNFWYCSKESEGFARMDVTLYDVNKTKIETLTGNRVMLSRSAELSEWTKVSTYAVVPKEAVYASFRFYILEGYNQVWVDDISMQVTETYYEKIVATSDFHAVTEENIVAEWDVTDGSLTAPEGVGTFVSTREGTISYRTTALVPGYGYQVKASYTASENMTADISYYDIKNEKVAQKEISLFATSEESILLLDTIAADATYAIFSITGRGALTIDDFYIYQGNYERVGKEGWKANVVWYPEDPRVDALAQYRYFRTTFQLEKEVESVYLQSAADDDTWGHILYNCTGSKIYATKIDTKKEAGKRTAYIYDLTSRTRQGKNVLAIRAHNTNGFAGLVFEIYINYTDGTSDTIYSSGESVKVSRLGCLNTGDMNLEDIEKPEDWYTLDFDDSDWVQARNLGVPPHCDINPPAYFYEYAPRYEIKVGTAPSEHVVSGMEHTTNILYTDEKHTELVPQEAEGHLYQGETLLSHVAVKTKFENGKAYFTYIVPDYLPEGEYTLKIREDSVGLFNGATDNVLCKLMLSEPAKKMGTGSVAKENGVVRLKINGQNASPMMYLRPHYTAHYYNYDDLSDVKDSGITLYVTYNGMLDGCDGNVIWTAKDTIDYETFDADIYRTLDLNPNAMVIANICMDAPQWWTEANLGECVTDEDGNILTYASASGELQKVSFASKKYREEATEVVKKLVEHMQRASYRNRICGIRLTGGRTYEWMQYNVDEATGTYPEIDYSQAMQTAFKEETGYDVPTVKERSKSIYNTFLDPSTQKNVLAYNEYLSQCVTDSLLTYAKAVKETEPDWLVGAYYGYLWFENSSLGIGGCHTTAEKVLDSPYIDFVASPVNYSERINGYKTGYMAMSESVAAHGKLYMLEQDNRTLYSKEVSEASSDNAVGLETTIEGTIRQLTRDMATNLVKGTGFWFYDMEGGWFSGPQITDSIKAIKEEYDIAQSRDMRTNSQVAVYVGSSFYNQLTADLLNGGNGSQSYYLVSQLYNRQRVELAKMGTSYDTYMIEDLCSDKIAVNWSQYKLHIMLSPIELQEEERKAIEEKVKKNGNVVLWVYLPGVSDGETFCAENLSDVIDMNVEVITDKSLNLTASITDETFGTVGENYGIDFGYTYRTPYAVVKDDSVTTLATYGNSRTDIAAAMKICDAYTSVYSGVGNVKAETLRKLCSLAGVFLYTEDKDTVVETNAGYLSAYSQVEGKKTITLDKAYDVYDVLQAKWIGSNLTSFTVDLSADETGLYRLDCAHGEKVTKITKATLSKNGVSKTSCVQCGKLLSQETLYAASKINLSATSLYANGKTQNVKVSVKDSKNNTIDTSNYTVSGTTSAKIPGTYRVTVTFKGKKYQGTKAFTWKIVPKSGASAKISTSAKVYTGKKQTVKLVVKESNGTVISTTNYTVSGTKSATSAGTYKVKVTFKGNYSGNKTVTWKISPQVIKSPKITVSSKTYTGKYQTVKLSVKDSKGKTISSKYYTISGTTKAKSVGAYKVKITFKGNYSGNKTVSWKISPKTTSISKLTKGFKKITVKWKKQTTQTKGYQIQYSTSKKFKSGVKTVTVKGTKTTSKTIAKLKAKKTYYVRIRTYNGSCYSKWSSVKSVKIK